MRRHKKHHGWKYKNLTFVVLGILVALLLSRFEAFHTFLLHLGNLGYIGAFIAGMLFTSTFTIATGAILLLVIAESLSPLEIGLIAALGGVIADMLIFRLVKDNLSSEITDIYTRIDPGNHLKKVFHSKYFSWTLPVIGGLIIASPLPDELGVSLMGLSKTSTLRFVMISYVFNFLGIFLIVSASALIKP